MSAATLELQKQDANLNLKILNNANNVIRVNNVIHVIRVNNVIHGLPECTGSARFAEAFPNKEAYFL
jgi:hypothetical protein